jgi:hypothetical protein
MTSLHEIRQAPPAQHFVEMDTPRELLIQEQYPKRPNDVTVVSMNRPVAEEYDTCHLGWAIVSVFMCGVCGITALVMSILGYTDHRTGNYLNYRKKRSCAIGFMVTAFLLGALILAAYVVYVLQYMYADNQTDSGNAELHLGGNFNVHANN